MLQVLQSDGASRLSPRPTDVGSRGIAVTTGLASRTRPGSPQGVRLWSLPLHRQPGGSSGATADEGVKRCRWVWIIDDEAGRGSAP